MHQDLNNSPPVLLQQSTNKKKKLRLLAALVLLTPQLSRSNYTQHLILNTWCCTSLWHINQITAQISCSCNVECFQQTLAVVHLGWDSSQGQEECTGHKATLTLIIVWMVALDLRGLFQPKQFYDSMCPRQRKSQEHNSKASGNKMNVPTTTGMILAKYPRSGLHTTISLNWDINFGFSLTATSPVMWHF